jgi:hypothetical protein
MDGTKALGAGWIGIAYLDPDPQSSDAGPKFMIAAHGDSFAELPERIPLAEIQRHAARRRAVSRPPLPGSIGARTPL